MNEKNQMDDLMLPLPDPTIHEDGVWHIEYYTATQMREYAKKAVEAEREACAKVCEAEAEKWKKKDLLGYVAVLVDDAAAAIRARRQA